MGKDDSFKDGMLFHLSSADIINPELQMFIQRMLTAP